MTTLRDIAHDIKRDNPHIGTHVDVEQMVKAVFGLVVEHVAKGHAVKIQGFGTFEAKLFKGRKLVSPLVKGGSLEFDDQLILRFRQSQSAKIRINQMAGDHAAAKANGEANALKAAKAIAKAEAKATKEAAKVTAKLAKETFKKTAKKTTKKEAAEPSESPTAAE